MLRRGTIIGIGLLGALALAAIAQAGSPPPQSIDNDYEGKAAHNRHTYVGFDLVTRHGTLKMKRFGAFLHYTCHNPPVTGGTLFGVSRGALTVKHNEFSGTVRVRAVTPPARGAPSFRDYKYELEGKLGKDGHARGTIVASLAVPLLPGKNNTSECRTEPRKLHWKAKKGANSVPVDPHPKH